MPGRLTIKHREPKIGMPSMATVFDVSDKAALAKLKASGHITLIASSSNGQLPEIDVSLWGRS